MTRRAAGLTIAWWAAISASKYCLFSDWHERGSTLAHRHFPPIVVDFVVVAVILAGLIHVNYAPRSLCPFVFYSYYCILFCLICDGHPTRSIRR